MNYSTIMKNGQMHNKIYNAFNQNALMPYITAGDPDLEMTKDIMLTLDRSGADLIEVGIPFSDPLLDGPVIQKAGQRALDSGTSLKKILRMLLSIKDEMKSPYLLMGAYNPILAYGKEKFINDAREAGVSGVIIPDLPFEQDIELYKNLKNNNILPIFMVTPVTSMKRLELYAENASGFLYCVSLLGVTGNNQGREATIQSYIDKIRNYTDIPLALGFGIDGPEKVKNIINFVDGVIIGTALVKIIETYSYNKVRLLKEINNFISDIKEVM